MGDEKITPQAGDLWRITPGKIWYFYKREYDGRLMSITDDEDKMLVEAGIEDGKNGWELAWREGWVKLKTMLAYEHHVSTGHRWINEADNKEEVMGKGDCSPSMTP